MYLANKIVTRDGGAFPMAGILPLSVQMTDRLVNFGYAEVSLDGGLSLGSCRNSRARPQFPLFDRSSSAGPMDQTYRVSYTLARREESEGFARQ